jgi:hypothetical protein
MQSTNAERARMTMTRTPMIMPTLARWLFPLGVDGEGADNVEIWGVSAEEDNCEDVIIVVSKDGAVVDPCNTAGALVATTLLNDAAVIDGDGWNVGNMSDGNKLSTACLGAVMDRTGKVGTVAGTLILVVSVVVLFHCDIVTTGTRVGKAMVKMPGPSIWLACRGCSCTTVVAASVDALDSQLEDWAAGIVGSLSPREGPGSGVDTLVEFGGVDQGVIDNIDLLSLVGRRIEKLVYVKVFDGSEDP